MKKRKAIVKKIRLEFTQDDFFIVVAKNAKAGFKALKKEGKGIKGYNLPKSMYRCPAYCWQQPQGFGVAVVFRFDDLKARYICHEVSHATYSMLNTIGVPLAEDTDEVYAYHNDM